MASDAVWKQEGESRLEITTHAERRLTDDDRAMAKRIDALGAG